MKSYLFSPGPVMVEEPVRAALNHYDICHRSPEFEALYADIQQKVLRLFEADETYCSVVISGSGTAANEACLSSVFEQEEEALLLSNGEFGERLYEILGKYQIPTTNLTFGWGVLPDLDRVEKALKDNPKITYICMVFHETSTGMINPVGEVGQLAKKYGKRFFVDCVSAAAGEHVDVLKNNIDLCTSVGGKMSRCIPRCRLCLRQRVADFRIDPGAGQKRLSESRQALPDR